MSIAVSQRSALSLRGGYRWLATAPRYCARARYSTTSAETEQPLLFVNNLPVPGTGHVRVLEINRPKALNAISRDLLAQLRSEIANVAGYYGKDGEELPPKKIFGGAAGVDEKGPTRALVIASAVNSCFSAGADLRERKNFTQEETAEFLHNLRSTFSELQALPIPTISAISSIALGGGLELALSTTFRVLTSNAVVGLPETRLGIIPGAGGTYRLPALIGLNRARDMILTGRRVTAPEAYFLGLADRLVEVLPDPENDEKKGGESASDEGKMSPEKSTAFLEKARRFALNEAVTMAQQISEGGPIAVRAALEAVTWAREEVEGKMYQRVVTSEDRNEALRAFQEKRKPVFSGR